MPTEKSLKISDSSVDRIMTIAGGNGKFKKIVEMGRANNFINEFSLDYSRASNKQLFDTEV